LAAESGLNIRIDADCLGVVVSQDPTPTYQHAIVPAPTAAPDNDASPGDAGSPDDDAIDGDDEPVISEPVMLQRGDIVTLVFAAVEEELAQSGQTE
jgi:hypothetical protein